MTEVKSAVLVTEFSMDPKRQFYALEVMCRERAAIAKKDLEYWLTEAEEWERLRLSRGDEPPASSSDVAPTKS
jgi:hypothetical protein